ncbi:Tc5 transposase DNA-binding domain [Popillia japonica]|uniref:Tc5 transposase DNA-binding domain n=1 Tax=Popillia japonica TaxID=7064 RepID=A0AAW1J1F4_POPJA
MDNSYSKKLRNFEYNLSHSAVTTIWRNQDKIKAAFNDNLLNKKKMRQRVHNDVEIALLRWFKDKRSKGIPINGQLLQQKAEEFCRLLNKENYKCSESWIKKFRACTNIGAGKISGESKSVNTEVTDDWIKTVWPKQKC